MLNSRNLVAASVLLVDDEPLQLSLRAQVLEMNGFSVLTACGPLEALSLIVGTAKRIDVAVLDYHMPIMNGCILADHLKSCRPEVKIILHSGAIAIPHGEMASVETFVPKSEGIASLIASIAQLASAATGAPELLVCGENSTWKQGRPNSDRHLFPFGEASVLPDSY
jgi:CheY-like chemotaxis protein